jgi:flagellar biosynthesis protein FliQ
VTGLLIVVALAVSLAVGATCALFQCRKIIEEMQDDDR